MTGAYGSTPPKSEFTTMPNVPRTARTPPRAVAVLAGSLPISGRTLYCAPVHLRR